MKAHIGDRIIQRGTHVDDRDRVGEVIELHHDDGTPPYVVRWSDGHDSLVFPGTDVRIEPPASATAP
jgi:hypothetical protein